MAHPTTNTPEEQPVSITLETPTEEITTRLADLTPEELAEFEAAIDDYNEGAALTVPQLADLFGVRTNTVYAAWIDPAGTHPSTELVPGNRGDNTFDVREAIIWGIQTGRLGYVKETRSFRRLRIPRLIWAGKPRGPHRREPVED